MFSFLYTVFFLFSSVYIIHLQLFSISQLVVIRLVYIDIFFLFAEIICFYCIPHMKIFLK